MANRPRLAVALFADQAAALRARAALMRLGTASALEPAADGGGMTLRVDLPRDAERGILASLLASDALRLDVHDAQL